MDNRFHTISINTSFHLVIVFSLLKFYGLTCIDLALNTLLRLGGPLLITASGINLIKGSSSGVGVLAGLQLSCKSLSSILHAGTQGFYCVCKQGKTQSSVLAVKHFLMVSRTEAAPGRCQKRDSGCLKEDDDPLLLATDKQSCNGTFL